MTRVYLTNIIWMNKDEQEISTAYAESLGLPKDDFVDLDEKSGIWSENGLEDQCYDALERKYSGTGMRPSLLWVDEFQRI